LLSFATTQIANLFSLVISNVSKDLKRLLDKDSPLVKVKTDISSNSVAIVSLEQFTKIVYKLAINGNKSAQDFAEILFELSLHQLFSDAFGVKFNKEERDRWLKARQTHRKQYHSCLTNWLNVDGIKGKNYGVQVNLFKVQADVPLITVDEYDSDDLLKLNNAEVRYDVLRRTGMNHQEAIKFLR
jgi:hypothetical protein